MRLCEYKFTQLGSNVRGVILSFTLLFMLFMNAKLCVCFLLWCFNLNGKGSFCLFTLYAVYLLVSQAYFRLSIETEELKRIFCFSIFLLLLFLKLQFYRKLEQELLLIVEVKYSSTHLSRFYVLLNKNHHFVMCELLPCIVHNLIVYHVAFQHVCFC